MSIKLCFTLYVMYSLYLISHQNTRERKYRVVVNFVHSKLQQQKIGLLRGSAFTFFFCEHLQKLLPYTKERPQLYFSTI